MGRDLLCPSALSPGPGSSELPLPTRQLTSASPHRLSGNVPAPSPVPLTSPGIQGPLPAADSLCQGSLSLRPQLALWGHCVPHEAPCLGLVQDQLRKSMVELRDRASLVLGGTGQLFLMPWRDSPQSREAQRVLPQRWLPRLFPDVHLQDHLASVGLVLRVLGWESLPGVIPCGQSVTLPPCACPRCNPFLDLGHLAFLGGEVGHFWPPHGTWSSQARDHI